MKSNQKGVTLIELLIVILIMVSISSLAFYLFSYGIKMERAVATENELQREARLIMETVSNAARDGEEIQIDSSYNLTEIPNKLEYNKSNGEIMLLLNNSVLSKNVKQFTATPISEENKRYKVTLVLENGDHSYEVTTEVFNDATKRAR